MDRFREKNSFIHSFLQPGRYPLLPVVKLSNLLGNTSSLPRKSERNKAMLSFSGVKFATAGCRVGEVMFNLVDLTPSFFLFKVSICLRSLSLLASKFASSSSAIAISVSIRGV